MPANEALARMSTGEQFYVARPDRWKKLQLVDRRGKGVLYLTTRSNGSVVDDLSYLSTLGER